MKNPFFPWGDPHGYPYGPHPMGGVGDVLIKGCTKLGIRVSAGGPVAITAGSHADRPHCIYRGFCIQGCKDGTLGKYLMVQIGNVLLGRFEEPIRMYKAPPAHALTEEFYETDPKRGFARGFAIQTVGPLPIAFSKQMMVAIGRYRQIPALLSRHWQRVPLTTSFLKVQMP